MSVQLPDTRETSGNHTLVAEKPQAEPTLVTAAPWWPHILSAGPLEQEAKIPHQVLDALSTCRAPTAAEGGVGPPAGVRGRDGGGTRQEEWPEPETTVLAGGSDIYGPWNSPGQNTGVGSLSLLQGIFPTEGSNPGLLH